VEALACGLFAIVSPEVAIAGDISQPGIGCTVPRDSDALARAVSNCIRLERFDTDSRSLRRAFVEERFSWTATANQLIAAYDEAPGGKKTSRGTGIRHMKVISHLASIVSSF